MWSYRIFLCAWSFRSQTRWSVSVSSESASEFLETSASFILFQYFIFEFLFSPFKRKKKISMLVCLRAAITAPCWSTARCFPQRPFWDCQMKGAHQVESTHTHAHRVTERRALNGATLEQWRISRCDLHRFQEFRDFFSSAVSSGASLMMNMSVFVEPETVFPWYLCVYVVFVS